jgi:aconitate hydratase
MSMIHQRPIDILTGTFGTVRHIDVRTAAGGDLSRMPLCHRVLLENVLRQPDADVAEAGRRALLDWLDPGRSEAEIPFAPSRILMHDTTCGPALVDIAAMRDALAEAGGDPARLNPACPVATSTDHSVAVDVSARPDALRHNMTREMERNAERYRFMKWAANTVRGFRVFPPGTGIMHTINMERLATVVSVEERDGVRWAVPDTLVGTDSHTPMINSLGVLGWGVGGIEAEAVMFGVPLALRIPEVIGVRLAGRLPEGCLATDLALVVTERLRKLGVAGEFVEFFGPGVASLSSGERSVVANMAPEYGASTGFFPIDRRTLAYLRDTGRDKTQCALVAAYAQAIGLWYEPEATPRYTETIAIDLPSLGPSLAGPRRPHDRLAPEQVPAIMAPLTSGAKPPAIELPDGADDVPDDAVAIAAITSCTNTTDLGLLIAAGLLARKARKFALRPPAWVKTSLTVGSPATERRLARVGLLDDLETLGFGIAAYGCATCIGNSGPLLPVVAKAMERRGIKPTVVLSGNRNFPGRVHPQLTSALLMSPPLVIAWALNGRAVLDVTRDSLGTGPNGEAIHLADLWPTSEEVEAVLARAIDPDDVAASYETAESSPAWRELPAPDTERFPWDADSTYLRRPPFVNFGPSEPLAPIFRAHPLIVLGDDITTDHISPASAIPAGSDAGRHLIARGANPRDLNVYASRRGNWEVMLRGLFTNRTVVNSLCPDSPPGHTVFAPTGEVLPVWIAAERYAQAGLPTVLIAGERYGTGSSRDWAAKGTHLLGVRAVLAQSFERIHRSNLVGMGILPLRIPSAWRPDALKLVPGDEVEVHAEPQALVPRASIRVVLRRASGTVESCEATALLETELDIALIRAGGVIPMILQRALAA